MFRPDIVNIIEKAISKLHKEEVSRPFMDSRNEFPDETRSLITSAKSHLKLASELLHQIRS